MTILNSEFAAFARRKEQAALTATLAAYLTALDDHDAGAMAIGNAWSRSLFDGSFYASPPPDQSQPACNLVFVQSKDGNTGSRNPTALGGGETDTHLIYEGLSRVAADAVMAGAETIRSGDMVLSVWHPELVSLRASLGKPRHPTQIVATVTGCDLDGGMLFNIPEIPVVLVTVGPAAAVMQNPLAVRPWITALVMERASDLGLAFGQLRSLGIERISCIGGRRIATQLIDAGLVHDLYLTTSPRTGGEPNTPLYPQPLRGNVRLRKIGTGPEAGVMFEHMSLTGRRS